MNPGAATYSQTVIDHFTNPRNVGRIDHADGTGCVESDRHQDLVELSIRICDGHIADCKFLALGCVAAIAASSMTTVLAIGLSLEEATQLSEAQVVQALGGLPQDKVACSVLCPEALRRALADYARER